MILKQLAKTVKLFPNYTAVKDENCAFSYQELLDRSKRIASKLLSNGVKKGDNITIELTKSCDYIASILGSFMVGACFAALDINYPEERLNYIADDCKAKLRLTPDFLKDIDKEPLLEKPIQLSSSDNSLLVYTSGSTGKPKGVLHTQESILDATVRISNVWESHNYNLVGQKMCESAPLSFVAGIQLALSALVNGLTLYLVPSEIVRDANELSKYIEENEINIAFMPPKVLKVYKNNAKSLHTVMTGSEKVSNVYRTDFEIINGYGSSESAGAVLFFNLDKQYENTPVGKSVSKEKVYILDDKNKEVDEGEICLTGHFAKEYLNLKDQTSSTFVSNPFKNKDGFDMMLKTHDIGRKLPDGNILFVNRKDWLIKINGQRVEPGEIEETIRLIPEIHDAAVKDFIGSSGQTYICAYYVLKEGKKTDESKIRDFLKSHLPSYMVPQYFVCLDKLPVNANGKLNRLALESPDLSIIREEYVAPKTEIEKELCSAFEKALNIDKIGINDDFFLLGGDSIKVMELERLVPSLDLSTKIIYENKTVKAIAKTLSHNKKSNKSGDLSKAYPLTQAQLGIFLECAKSEGEAVYNNPVLLSFSNKTDIKKLSKAIEGAVLAHPGLLSTVLIDKAGNPQVKYNEEFSKDIVSLEEMSEEKLNIEKTTFEKPFILTQDRLFRFKLIKTEKKLYLFLDIHHLVFDGFSMHVLLSDIIDAYNGKKLEKESFTAFDQSIKEKADRDSSSYEVSKSFYLETFSDVDEVSIPEGDLNKKELEFGLSKVKLNVSYKELKEYCLKNKTTENVVTSTAFGILLSSYIMSKKAAFATVYNGRHDLTTDKTVSMFVRTLPVLYKVNPSLKVNDFLKEMKNQMMGAMVNDIYSFRELAQATGYTSDILFTWQGDLFQMPSLEGEDIKLEDLPFNATGERLSCQIYPKDNDIELNVQYHANIYSEEWIKLFIERYSQVLKNLITKEYMKDVSLVDDKTTKELIKLSYGGDLDFDKNVTFIQMFVKNAKDDPDHIAVVDKNGSYTYKELDNASNIIANYLIKNGVREKEFVAIKMERVKEFMASVLGIQKAGAAYVPIDPAYPDDRISYMVEDSKAKVVLTLDLVNEILKSKDNKPVDNTKESNPAYMIYTSGSTGKPKGVVILNHSLSALIAWNKKEYNLNKESRCAAHASFSFDASVIDIFPSLSAGGSLYILDEELRMDLDKIKEYFEKNKITGLNSSTAIAMSLINAHPDITLEYYLMGGEKMLPVKKSNIKKLINGYGPTEFTVCSSYHIVDQDKEKDIPIGRAVPNSYSFICDMNGALLPQGMVGELCLSGIQIAQGYWNREELTNERFAPCAFMPGSKMYHTGDLARYNKDGELEYMGRIDFQVKLRGFRIELGEIENCACQYNGIKQAAAEVRKNQLVLYYTSSIKIDEVSLKHKLGETLTEYMVPTVYVCLDEMPMTPNGKINRKALPEPDIKADEIIAPRNDNEQKAYDILSSVLGYSEFGVTTDFNNAGLTSLGAMQFVSRLAQEFNVSIRLNELDTYPTIRELIEYITNKNEDASYDIQKDYPLTMAQKGILTEVLAHPDTTIYNIPLLIELPKEININKFIESVKNAINAHPYLKMRLITNSEGNIRAERHDEDEPVISIINKDMNAQDLVKPFDLLKESLYRAIILKGKTNKFFFDAHHIAFDGESVEILLKDIASSYEGKKIEKETYTEFEIALDEEERHQGKILEDAKEWYTKLLDGRDVDCLPVNDHNLKDQPKGEFKIDVDINKDKIESFLKDNKTTINALWISSFGLALSRFLNRKDAIFTTVYNGRNDVKMNKSVGMFVHTLPVMLEPFATSTASEYVSNTGAQIKKSMANDIYGFMEIAHDLEVRADILFVYEGKIGSGFVIDNKKAPHMELLSNNQTKSAVLVAISETDNGYTVNIEYDGNKYEDWSLKSLTNAMILSFKALVNNENPNEISLITKEDKETLNSFNKTDTKVEKTTLVALFKEMATKYPNNTAVIYDNQKLTYKEVDELTDIIASNLADRGIGRGKVVSVMVKRSLNMVICPLSVMKTGAAYQPLDSSYPVERLEFMVKDANAQMIILDKELESHLPNNKLPLLYTEDFKKLEKKDGKLEGPKPEDLMILLYTSGTTGTPKGVMLCQFNLVNFCAWYRKYYNLTPESVESAYAGFGFDACMMDMYPALTTGAAVCIVPEDMRMNLDELKEYFAKNKVSHTFMTTQVGRMFAEENDTCYSLKNLSVGGEKLAPVSRIPSGYKFFNGYGPTECTIFSTTQLYDKQYDRIPIGKPLDNYKLYVVDSNLKEVPVGCMGELLITGFGVGLGYLNLEEKTKTTFIKNPFSSEPGYERAYRTGDVVRRLNNGAIDFIGRNDGQVKIRGFRIELTEVEMVIREYPDIKDVTVQAFKDEQSGGMFLAAYFTSDKFINIEKLKEFIGERKPPYMVPPSIMQLESIPLNQNQKVNKRALPQPVFQENKSNYVEPSTPLEKSIAEIYHDVLGQDKISATDSFFDIGGTSLTAARVVMHALNKGYQIAYKDVFDNPSPRELAKLIESRKNVKDDKVEVIADEKEENLKSLQFNDVKYVDEIKNERELGTVLLCGSTGFLGIHILRELLNNKIKTLVLVRGKDVDPLMRLKGMAMYYFDSPLEDEIKEYVTVINGDITDAGLLESLKDYKFDTIINSAACVKHFAKDDIIERINFHGVENLINVAKEKNARLIQVSTLSVAGENLDHKFDSSYLMKENQLFFGQDLSNKYANSKFKAEEAILNAIDKGELDGKIIRVGNLMSRQSDGEFQINSITNAFMKTLKGYKVLGKFPIALLDNKIDFSPIDEIAKTILLLSTTPSKFTVFHSMNSHQVQMGDVIDAMNLAGIKIDKVNMEEFNKAVSEAMQDEKTSMMISSLFSYASGDNHSREFIQSDLTFTVKALYRLGYRWPITDFDYLIKAIESLESLGFFDREDI